MKGENVLHAMGYDAFGLPAEQYAVQTGQHPRVTTEANIANMSRQLHRMGPELRQPSYVRHHRPGYVRWTQWIFSRIYDSWYDEDATNPSGSRGSARRSPSSWPSSNPAKRPFRATSPTASSGPTSLTPSSRIS